MRYPSPKIIWTVLNVADREYMMCDTSLWLILMVSLLLLPRWDILERILCLLWQVVLIKIVLLMLFNVIKLACTAQMKKEQRIRLLMTTVFATCLARLLYHVINFILPLFHNFCVLLNGIKLINWHSNIPHSFLSEEAVIAMKMATKTLSYFSHSKKLLLPFSK